MSGSVKKSKKAFDKATQKLCSAQDRYINTNAKKEDSLMELGKFQTFIPDKDVVFFYLFLFRDVTRRCRLSVLTNSALVIRVQIRGEGGVAGSQPRSADVHIT
jgi:hypothetical protein